GVADLVARGIACLIVDGPGNGESIRFRELYLRPDTEHYATPVFDYLAARPEGDARRIGVIAISLGGYYAPRAAAFEKRYACCLPCGRRNSKDATRAASPGVRSGTTRRSGATVSSVSRAPTRRRFRSRTSTLP